jgi:TIR domain
LDIWIDQLDIASGARWDQAVEDALKNCPGFLIVLSPASVASQNVMDELAFAIEQGKRILPILYQKCESPFRIRRLQFIDFTGDYGEAFDKLLGALNASTPNGRKKPSPAKPSFLQRIASKRTLIALLIAAALATLGGGLMATWETIFPSGCAARSDYPLGKWETKVHEATSAGYSTSVDFLTSSSGIWEKGTFTASTKPTPGRDVTLVFSMPNDSYSSTDWLRVSADGCSMEGQFRDNQKPTPHTGNVTYTWQVEKRQAR